MRLGAMALGAVMLVGCASLLGIEGADVRPSESGGGGSGATSSTGGMAGAGGIADGGGGAGGDEGGSGGGLPPPSSCGTLDELTDDFATQQPHWNEFFGGGGISFGGNLLTLTAPAGMVVSPSVLSDSYFRLRESQITFELADLTLTDQATATLQLVGPDDREVRFEMTSTNLLFVVDDGTMPASLLNTTFDITLHRYLRIQESGGELSFGLSGDGVSYEVDPDTVPTADIFPGDYVRVRLGLFSNSGSGPSDLQINSINVPDNSREGWCPTGSLSDDFAGDPFEPQWALSSFSPSCTVNEDGNLSLALPNGAESDTCLFYSASPFDLTGDGVTIDVLDTDVVGTANVFLSLNCSDGGQLLFNKANDNLYVGALLDLAMSSANVNYELSQHRRWRIREEGGTAYFDVAGTGPFTNLLDVPLTSSLAIDVTRCFVAFGLSGSAQNASSVIFDELNTGP